MKKNQFLYDIGFVNELGCNISKYAYLKDTILFEETDSNKKYKDFFDNIINTSKLSKFDILNNLNTKYSKQISESEYKDSYNDLCSYAYWNGWVQGSPQINNFFYNIGKKNIKRLYYLQANFINPLGLQRHTEEEKNYYKNIIKLFFSYDLDNSRYERYTSKGKFLKADFILAVEDDNRNLHIMIVDNKVDLAFLLKHHDKENGVIDALANLNAKKNKKVQFKNINADTSSLDLDLSSRLVKYAHIVNDKNIPKVVQAGSYASSFVNFLENIDELEQFNEVYVSLVGDIDTDTSTINLSLKDKNGRLELSKMRDSYENLDRDMSKEEQLRIIKKAYKQLRMSLNHTNLDTNNKEFDRFLNTKENKLSYFCIEETIDDFKNTMKGNPNMQEKHGDVLTEKFLNDKNQIICFLAGCPGIGKTYAFKKYTGKFGKEVTFYFSPRNAVNEDFAQFYFKNNQLKQDDRIILTASSTDEKSEDDMPIRVINYITKNPDNLPKKTKLTFKEKNRIQLFEENKTEFDIIHSENKILTSQSNNDGVFARTVEAVRDVIYDSPNINKITAYLTIQGQKKSGVFNNTAVKWETLFDGLYSKSRMTKKKRINNEKFEEFASKCPNIYIMIDEITGTSEGVELFLDIYRIFVKDFYNLLNEEQKKKINLKIIVADASLPNAKIMKKHLIDSEKVEQEKIYFSSEKENIPKDVYTEYIDDKKIKGLVINANAYPAEKLNLKYHMFSQSHKIKSGYRSRDDRKIEREKRTELRNEVNEKIIENAIDDIYTKKYSQAILFIQDKKRIDEIVELLNEQWIKKFNKSLELGEEYIILSAELNDKQRSKYIKTVNSTQNQDPNTNTLKFVFITSTASRGISFKACRSMHILLQNFNLEEYLMELIQCVYRPRGNRTFDSKTEKYLNFYSSNFIAFSDDVDENEGYQGFKEDTQVTEFEYKKNQMLLNTLSYITLVRGAINTRIKGYTTINKKNYSLVAVGGKSVSSASNSLLEHISEFMICLEKEHRSIKFNGDISKEAKDSYLGLIKDIIELIIEVFSETKIKTHNSICKKGVSIDKVYSKFIEAWTISSSKLLDLSLFEEYKVINGIMVFETKKVEDYLNFFKDAKQERENLIKMLRALKTIPEIKKNTNQICTSIIDLIDIELIRGSQNSISYYESNNNRNRFIGIPLYAFALQDSLKNYNYENQYKEEDDDDTNVIKLLKSSIRQYSSCQNVQPIISDFSNSIPYITFKSDNLNTLYQSMYNKNHLLSSTETNIFNLVLLPK